MSTICLHPEVKSKLWGGQFWTEGYYVNTVGQYANEDVIQRYIDKIGNPVEEKILEDGVETYVIAYENIYY